MSDLLNKILGETLDLKAPCSTLDALEETLRAKVIGQDRALRRVARQVGVGLAGLASPRRPLGVLLFLGPTGVGKTHVVEALAETLGGSPEALVKLDCAEFAKDHEVAKLLGAPPGYLGHGHTRSRITQQVLEEKKAKAYGFTLVLFDELEKADEALREWLLGVMDKGKFTDGENREVDMSRTLIFLTSNLGTREATKLLTGGLGFAGAVEEDAAAQDQELYRVTYGAARKTFSPEFINRLDRVVVFRPLGEEDLRKVLRLELGKLQERLLGVRPVVLRYTQRAEDFLLAEGYDPAFGARHLKRGIERFVTFPLSRLLLSGALREGDIVEVDQGLKGLTFGREGLLAPAQAA